MNICILRYMMGYAIIRWVQQIEYVLQFSCFYETFLKAEGRVALSPKYVYPELPAPASGDEYTADELITIYHTIIEADGITWDTILKGNWDETIGKYDIFE